MEHAVSCPGDIEKVSETTHEIILNLRASASLRDVLLYSRRGAEEIKSRQFDISFTI